MSREDQNAVPPAQSGDPIDVLVAGSGAAGIAAAVTAARHGLATLLLDKRSAAGGTGGFSGLTTLCGCYDDQGRMLNHGFAREFVERVAETEAVRLGRVWVLPYRPHRFRAVAEELIRESKNVRTQWDTSVDSITLADGEIKSVNGISIRTVIDCTGIAEVAQAAGLPCLETTPVTQSAAIVFPLCHVKRDLSTRAAVTRVMLALARAKLPSLAFEPNLEPETVTVKFSGPADRVPATIDFLRRNVSGFENCATPVTSFVTSHRAGRMIRGEYLLKGEDALHGKKFPDAVARCAWPIEQWDEAGRVRLRYLPAGDHYEIPARSLKAAGIRNLFMAGKTISADEDAIASARVMGCCLATGTAAGNLAAQWITSGREK